MSSLATHTDTSLVLHGEAEHAAWALATPAEQREVQAWLKDMQELLAAGSGKRGMLAQRIANRRAMSLSTVQTKYYAWRKYGWQALLNKSKVKPSATLPPSFVEFWKSLVSSHQRRKTTVKQAFRALMARLEAWEREDGAVDSQYAIPGYLTAPRRLQLTRYPAGWSYATLNRLKPAAHERTLRSIGPKAYSMFLPPTRASRVGMVPGELYFFDDEQPDVWVNFVGTNRKAMRPLGFHCLDFVSACNLAAGFRPQILVPDEGRVKSLTLRQFEWFVVWVLMERGYRPEGTNLVGELGTAKFTERFSDALALVTEGKVITDASGRFGDPAFRGLLYEGQSTGNFKFKAPLESFFNLLRNGMSALPGATGRNRDEAPEETTGLMRANAWFLKQLEEQPLERMAQLISPIIEWGAFVSWAQDFIRRVNNRRDHQIKDYAALGFTLPVLDLNGQEFPVMPEALLKMEPQERAKLEMLTAAGHARIVNMKPSEVWDRHSKGLRKVRGWHVPTLMTEEAARIVKVDSRFELKVDDQDLGSEPLCYIATSARNMHSQKITLERGKEYLCYLNPYSAGTMEVCEAGGGRHGAWIGTVALNPTYSRTDQHGLWANYQANREATAPERSDIERRAGAEMRRRVEDLAWNKRVSDTSKPLTPNEKQTAAAREEAEAAVTAAPARKPAAAKPARDLRGPDPFACD